jgi:hypothetical protein
LIPQTLPSGQHHPGIALPAAGTIKGTSSLQGGYSSPWKSSKNFCRKDLETFEAKSIYKIINYRKYGEYVK